MDFKNRRKERSIFIHLGLLFLVETAAEESSLPPPPKLVAPFIFFFFVFYSHIKPSLNIKIKYQLILMVKKESKRTPNLSSSFFQLRWLKVFKFYLFEVILSVSLLFIGKKINKNRKINQPKKTETYIQEWDDWSLVAWVEQRLDDFLDRQNVHTWE